LTGLSATQHHHYRTNTSISSSSEFASAFSWQSSPMRAVDNVYDKADRLVAFHPLFVIPHQAAANMRLWCESNPIAT
jgi:protein farnesyltransferase subunit beta